MLDAIARSIRYKFALVVLAATFAALLVAGGALVAYELRTYEQEAIADITLQADILGRAAGPALAFDDAQAAYENLALLRAKPQILAAALYNARGKLVADYRGTSPQASLPALPETDGVRVQDDELLLFKRIVENREIVGTVYMSSRYELPQRLRDYLGILGLVMLLSLAVAGAMWVWLQNALTRPLRALSQAAHGVMERRDFAVRVEKTTRDELGDLVDAFNGMLAELGRREEALEQANRLLEHEAAERSRADEDIRKLNAELERRVSERTSQLEAANKELESFSYSVSHDLRAPLRWIVGFSDALMEDHGPALDEEARRKIGIIQNEGRRMGQLIDDLLAFSRLGRKALQVGELDMTSLARATWDGLKSQQATDAVQLHIAGLPPVQGDRVLLGQVWANLLSNALKFSGKRDAPRIDVSAVTDEREHIFFVRDNGAGFNPKYQDKLFGVFQRLHDASEFPGTGVGLALVQRIVARHGGRVWADGKPGEGATFYFTLPKESGHGRV